MTQVQRSKKCWQCGAPLEVVSVKPTRYKHAVSWGCKHKNPIAATDCDTCGLPIMKAGIKSIQFGCLCAKPKYTAHKVPQEKLIAESNPPPKPKPQAKPKPKQPPKKVSLVKHPLHMRNRVDMERVERNLAKHEPYRTLDIFIRDGWKCYLCGRSVNRPGDNVRGEDGRIIFGTKDHIVPLSLGGEDTIRNVKLACSKCNTDKGNKPDQIDIMQLLSLLPKKMERWELNEYDKKDDAVISSKIEIAAEILATGLIRVAVYIALMLGVWWLLEPNYSIAKFIAAGMIIGVLDTVRVYRSDN